MNGGQYGAEHHSHRWHELGRIDQCLGDDATDWSGLSGVTIDGDGWALAPAARVRADSEDPLLTPLTEAGFITYVCDVRPNSGGVLDYARARITEIEGDQANGYVDIGTDFSASALSTTIFDDYDGGVIDMGDGTYRVWFHMEIGAGTRSVFDINSTGQDCGMDFRNPRVLVGQFTDETLATL